MDISDIWSVEAAIASLETTDPGYPPSSAATALLAEVNRHLLRYVSSEAFTHVFPGDETSYDEARFFADLDDELRNTPHYHLWAEVPLCKYRCHFCQFPILVLGRDPKQIEDVSARWVDANITEARLWCERVPSLRTTPVGEFCLFGGTPTAVPGAQLERLVNFYRDTFCFDDQSSLRVEGSPDTLDESAIRRLRRLGFDKLTFGIQSFDDELLRVSNRRHSGAQAARAIEIARRHGFERVDGDLVWGLPGQTVDGFLADVEQMLALGFDTIVAIKLHLRSFHEVSSAIGHTRPAVWEDPEARRKLAERGYRWPSLGEQLQMREQAVKLLSAAGHYEHPTTYFPSRRAGPEVWRMLNLDQELQAPQVGIGLGGYTWSRRSEANVTTDPHSYNERVANGQIPLTLITGTSERWDELRSVRMALTTCQPLREHVHRQRFPARSLFTGQLGERFRSLQDRGLAEVDTDAGEVRLTPVGATLVEAIINTEFRPELV